MYPELKIGKAIVFHMGLCQTEDPAVQEQIEGHRWFGSHIVKISATKGASAPSVPPSPPGPPKPPVNPLLSLNVEELKGMSKSQLKDFSRALGLPVSSNIEDMIGSISAAVEQAKQEAAEAEEASKATS